MTNYLIPTLIALFIFDLLMSAMRASLLSARPATLLSVGEQRGVDTEPSIALLKQRLRLRAGLKLAHALLRFSLAAVTLLLMPWEELAPSVWALLGVLLGVGVLLWLAEYLVERWVSGDSESWALRLTPFARLILGVLTPLLLIPLGLQKLLGKPPEKLVTVTESELKSLVDASQQEGVLEQEEGKMIYSIFQLGDTLAREIMVPRIDMFTLDVDTPLEEAVDGIIESGYSRIPVFEEHIDNILGLLYTKDLLRVWRENNQAGSLRELLRPVNFVPEAKKVDELLAEMQGQRVHIAVVVDEYGGVAGLVTLEDIVEEIFGEIHDEYDQAEELPYQQVGKNEYLFHGRIDLDDLNEIMGSELPTHEADTLGGLIYSRLGRVPRTGEQIEEDGLLLTIEQVSSRRIQKVRAQRVESPPPEDGEGREGENHAKR